MMNDRTAPRNICDVELNCELCEARAWTTLMPRVGDYITGDAFSIERCESCGLVVTSPMPAEREIGKYYPARYRSDRQKFTETLRTKWRARDVEKHFPKNFRGRILDIGCGSGAFAKEMKRRGWDVAVTEINQEILSELSTQGIDARLPDHHFEEPFDAITAWHVLEHVHHPLALANQAKSQLNSNGIFQIAVPNLASWQAKMSGKNWLHLDVPRHLYHFTPVTVKKLLDAAELSIVDTGTVAIEYDLFGVMQSALNAICSKQNVLFERLTSEGEVAPARARDVIVSYLLAPFFGGIGLVHCAFAGAFHRGATLRLTTRIKA